MQANYQVDQRKCIILIKSTNKQTQVSLIEPEWNINEHQKTTLKSKFYNVMGKKKEDFVCLCVLELGKREEGFVTHVTSAPEEKGEENCVWTIEMARTAGFSQI